MIPTFDEWMAENASPAENYSFAQYGRYAEGWRNSMPWAYRGMSIAYDRWAESRWDQIKDKDRLVLAWKEGLALKAKALSGPDQAWRGRTTEDAADFMLTFRDTLSALVRMALAVHCDRATGDQP